MHMLQSLCRQCKYFTILKLFFYSTINLKYAIDCLLKVQCFVKKQYVGMCNYYYFEGSKKYCVNINNKNLDITTRLLD